MQKLSPYEMVSLLELLKHNAEAFCRLSSLIGQMMVGTKFGLPAYVDGLPQLSELQREAERLGLASTSKQVERVYNSIDSDLTPEKIHRLLNELYLRLLDELEDRK